jgi:integrase
MTQKGRRHFGSVRRLPSGRWQASYWHDGERRVAAGTFLTKADALAFLSTVEADLVRGTWIETTVRRVMVRELADAWLASNPGKRPDTYATDEYHLRAHILPALGECQVSKVTPADVQVFVNDLASRLAPRTVRRSFGVARAMFAHAVASDMIARSPCRYIKLPVVRQERRRVPTPEELARLAAAMPAIYRPMIYLGVVLGLRFSEVAGLRVGRIDFARSVLTVAETITRDGKGRPVSGPPKSSASNRTISLPRQLTDLIVRSLASRGLTTADAEALVFPAPDGGPIRYANWRNRVWLPACNTAEVDGIGFHSLRRASATALVLEGVDVKTAQERLGHSDPRLTLGLYAQAVSVADRDASDRLGEKFMSGFIGNPSDDPIP